MCAGGEARRDILANGMAVTDRSQAPPRSWTKGRLGCPALPQRAFSRTASAAVVFVPALDTVFHPEVAKFLVGFTQCSLPRYSPGNAEIACHHSDSVVAVHCAAMDNPAPLHNEDRCQACPRVVCHATLFFEFLSTHCPLRPTYELLMV